MKSLRDFARKMPENRKGLETYVLNCDDKLRARIEADPNGRGILENAVSRNFDKYSPYINGIIGRTTHGLSAGGHAVGYSADAWLATGDIVGSLGGNTIDLLAQVPEKAYSLVYAANTGDYLGSMQNIFEGLVSYLPGLTFADQGLSRIIQKRMVKNTIYDLKKELGEDEVVDDKNYTDVKDRRANVISPHYEASLSTAA